MFISCGQVSRVAQEFLPLTRYMNYPLPPPQRFHFGFVLLNRLSIFVQFSLQNCHLLLCDFFYVCWWILYSPWYFHFSLIGLHSGNFLSFVEVNVKVPSSTLYVTVVLTFCCIHLLYYVCEIKMKKREKSSRKGFQKWFCGLSVQN